MILNNESYDKFIDGCTEAVFLFLWFCGVSLIHVAVTWALVYGFYHLMLAEYTAPPFKSMVLYPSLILSLPTTYLIFYIRKARRIYHIEKFRDFWICFAACVKLGDVRDRKSREIEGWMKENCTSLYLYLGYQGTHYFLNKEDAVQFKLRWMGE